MPIITRKITNNLDYLFTIPCPGENNNQNANLIIPASVVDLDLLTLTTEDNLWTLQPQLLSLQRIGAISVTGTIDTASFEYGSTANVVQFVDVTTHSTTGTAFDPTALTATITPSSISSKVKITVTGNVSVSNATNGMNITILNGSTDLSTSGSGFSQFVTDSSSERIPVSISYVDSPASISPVIYTVAINSGTNGQNVTWNPAANDTIIILEEILQ